MTNLTFGALFGYSSVNSMVSLNTPSSKGVSAGPKITAFHNKMLLSVGAAITPAGASCCNPVQPRERSKAVEAQQETARDRNRETETETERQRQRETERERQRETERDRKRETERERQRQNDRDREQTERQRQTETDRDRQRPIPLKSFMSRLRAGVDIVRRLCVGCGSLSFSLSLCF